MQYNETQLRPEFVNPFFKALGRDVDNKQGYVDAYTQAFNRHHMQVGHLFQGRFKAIVLEKEGYLVVINRTGTTDTPRGR